jgi:predicted RNA-binding protein with PIN domain
MPLHLLIDGYNFGKRGSLSPLFDSSDLESGRRLLLEKLSEYRKNKGIRITVVFDATGGLSLSRQKEFHKGIEVIYSRQGETADEVIIAAIRRKIPGLMVATSDRAIIDEAKRHGVTFITADRLEAAIDGGDEEETSERAGKKGNARKAPKGVRKARRMIKKV